MIEYELGSSRFQYLDAGLFPDEMNLYRYDLPERVSAGFKTARSILGETAGFGFFDDDVLQHLSSTYESRLSNPSRSNGGVGTPFISCLLNPSLSVITSTWVHNTDKRLYRIETDRSEVIIPTSFQSEDCPQDWQLHAPEVLVIGDVAPSQVEEIR